ncbi:HIT family protein, partial [Pseudomonas aeruginosa]
IHFHVIPRFSGENLGIHAAKQGDPEVLAQLQERLAQRLQG